MATQVQTGFDETDILRRVQDGETDLFYELVRPCERAVFLAALGIANNEADAEECAQEAILKAFRNLSRFRGESKFSTWLIQITINEARMRVRKRRSHLYESIDEQQQATDEGSYIPKDFADWREIPLEALESKHLRLAIRRAVESLPQKYRSVFVLRDIQQLNIEETAGVLGISIGNVKTRLSRARLQMRDALAPGWRGTWAISAETECHRSVSDLGTLPQTCFVC
jgi:RNA polymerase sigma-70 factor (ECF subfamily)